MPELPEVETIRRGLKPFILKKKVIQVKVDFAKAFWGKVEDVEGATVVGLRRRGKALLIDLSSGKTVMVHLRMTGQLIWRDDLLSERISSLSSPVRGSRTLSPTPLRASSSPRTSSPITKSSDGFSSPLTSSPGVDKPSQLAASLDSASSPLTSSLECDASLGDETMTREKYDELMAHQFAAGHPSKNFTEALPNAQTRVTLCFADGKLFFNDQRKFGFMKVLDTDKVEQEKFIAELGKEPWEMTAGELFEKCQRHGKALIKAVLLDQKVIAGLGNIYADESLFYAGVHPMRRAGSLNEEEVAKILEGACKVMTASIESGGSTMATYVRPDGTTGDYLEKFAQVFRKEGTPCPRCGEKIVKIRVAGRGTHICPKCQEAL